MAVNASPIPAGRAPVGNSSKEANRGRQTTMHRANNAQTAKRRCRRKGRKDNHRGKRELENCTLACIAAGTKLKVNYLSRRLSSINQSGLAFCEIPVCEALRFM